MYVILILVFIVGLDDLVVGSKSMGLCTIICELCKSVWSFTDVFISPRDMEGMPIRLFSLHFIFSWVIIFWVLNLQLFNLLRRTTIFCIATILVDFCAQACWTYSPSRKIYSIVFLKQHDSLVRFFLRITCPCQML